MSCNYKSITLAAGEEFILPPGATIVSASDTTAIGISNYCTNLNDLEELECYNVLFVSADNHDNGDTHLGEPTTHEIVGLHVNNTFYPYSLRAADCGRWETWRIADWISNHVELKNIIFPFYTGNDGDCNNGGYGTMCFKIIPSLAADMYFSHQWVPVGVGSPEPIEEGRVYARKASDYQGRIGSCSC